MWVQGLAIPLKYQQRDYLIAFFSELCHIDKDNNHLNYWSLFLTKIITVLVINQLVL